MQAEQHSNAAPVAAAGQALAEHGLGPGQLANAVIEPVRHAGGEVVTTTGKTVEALAADTEPVREGLARTGKRMRRTLRKASGEYTKHATAAAKQVDRGRRREATRARRAARRQAILHAARRRWPWLALAAGLLAAGIVAAVRASRSEDPLTEVPDDQPDLDTDTYPGGR